MSTGNVYGGQFCSPEERQITTIGSGYLANFISTVSEGAEVNRGGATLTNKRLYYSGQTLVREGKGISATKEQTIVNVRDITGTGYTFYSPLYYIVRAAFAGMLSLVGFMQGIDTRWGETIYDPMWITPAVLALAIVIAYIVAYFIKRKTTFLIEYAGGKGRIEFDVRWFDKKEQDNFIRNIHLVKDRLYSVTAVEQGFASVDNMDDDIDEIPDL